MPRSNSDFVRGEGWKKVGRLAASICGIEAIPLETGASFGRILIGLSPLRRCGHYRADCAGGCAADVVKTVFVRQLSDDLRKDAPATSRRLSG